MAESRAKRSALRGREQRLFNMVFMKATSTQWGIWLRAPLECSVADGDLATTVALLKAGATPFGHEETGRLGELLLAHSDSDHPDVIHVACLFEHDTLMEELLRSRCREGQGISPEQLAAYLRLALQHACLSAVKALLAAGADCALRHPEDACAALDVATLHGDLKIMALLTATTAAGGDGGTVNVNSACRRGYTALHRAAHYDRAEAIGFLLAAGALVDPKDGAGWTPLFDACAEGSMNALAALLQHGADRWHLARGRGLLHVAAERGHLPVVMTLLHHGRRDVDLRYGDSECSPLDFAVIAGHAGVARVLVEDGGADVNDSSSDGRTALHRAAFFNQPTAVDELFWAGANLEAETSTGCFRWTPIFDAAAAGSTEALLALLRHGASVDVLDLGGRAPLHVAIDADHTAACSALLSGGANPFLRHGDRRESVLDVAIREGNLDVVFAIIQSCPAGLLGSADSNGCTALHNAARAGEASAVAALLEAGAAADPRDSRGWTPLFAACEVCCSDAAAALLRHGADANALDVEGRSPLYLVAQLGLVEPTELLLAAGADVGRRFGKSECSPLDLAVVEGHVGVVEAMIRHGGADVDAVDRGGRTAAHRACFFDQHAALVVLVERGGASVAAEDGSGRTPLDVATARGSKGAAILLSTLSAATAPPSPPGPDPDRNSNAVTSTFTNNNGGSGFSSTASADVGEAFEASPPAAAAAAAAALKQKICFDDSSPGRSREYAALLAKRVEAAPADRAWRRRILVLCRARFARLRLLKPGREVNSGESRGGGGGGGGGGGVVTGLGGGAGGRVAGTTVGDDEEASAKTRSLPGHRFRGGREGAAKTNPLRGASGGEGVDSGDEVAATAAAAGAASASVMVRVVLLVEDGLFRKIVGFL